jgi:C4-type Zn-finger protein
MPLSDTTYVAEVMEQASWCKKCKYTMKEGLSRLDGHRKYT